MAIPTLTLTNRTPIPQLGFGTYKLAPEEAQRAVETAIEVGYRHIDGAAMYRNEREVGAAIRASGLRDELFLTSKLDNPYHEPAAAKAAFDRTMDDLGIDVLDLYLIHWPLARSTDYVATWGALIEIWQTGRVREIGVSNFTAEHIKRIVAATGFAPAVNQVEINPYFTQDDLREFHASHRIMTEGWSPLGRGRLLADPVIVEIAGRVGKTPAQVVLRWHLERGDVVFPKSSHRERMAENLDVTDFQLNPVDVAAITALNRDERSGSGPDDIDPPQHSPVSGPIPL